MSEPPGNSTRPVGSKQLTIRQMMVAVAILGGAFGTIALLSRLDGVVVLVVLWLTWPLLGLGLVFGINARTNSARHR